MAYSFRALSHLAMTTQTFYVIPDDKIKHECIPVGCVLSVAVAILGVGVVYPGGVCQKGGRCLPGGWVNALEECLPRDVHLTPMDRQTPVKT